MAFSSSPLFSTTGDGLNTQTTGTVSSVGCDLITAVVGGLSGLTAPTDDQGAFSLAVASHTGRELGIYYRTNPTQTSSYSASGSTFAGTLCMSGWSGSSATPLDQTSSGNNGNSTPIDTGSLTPTVDGSLIIAGVVSEGTGAATVDNSFTFSNNLDGTFYNSADAYFIQSTAGSIHAAFDDTNHGNKSAIAVSFKPGSGGGPPPATTSTLPALGVGV